VSGNVFLTFKRFSERI